MLVACVAIAAGPGTRAVAEPIHPLPAPPRQDAARVALGARLFGDPRLSGDGRIACASCHAITGNGAGATALSVIDGRQPPLFNTPTVFNAALAFRLNWQGGFRTLESQALASLENPRVMQADVATVIQRLRDDAALSREFIAAYGRPPDKQALLDAIASYERSLLTPESRFDRWLGGDDAALTVQELRGYHTFKSVGCIACHQGRAVGGNLFQRSGVFEPAARNSVARLRVPSLRNVAATAPYFHDGSAATLPVAIDAMARAQLGVRLRAQEVADISAFLRTLTGTHAGRRIDEGVPDQSASDQDAPDQSRPDERGPGERTP